MILALLIGFVIGSVPTADWLARLTGVSLRQEGSGNPGANNAFRLGGVGLAIPVLLVEVAKGVAAVWVGAEAAGSAGAALGGIGATAANIYNPWFKGRGGKGLAITAGALAAAWPLWLPIAVVTIGAGLAYFRRTGPAALVALGVVCAVALVGLARPLGSGWLIPDPGWAAAVALGATLLILPKQIGDARR